MADATRKLDIVISAKDEASSKIKSLGASFGNLVNDAKVGSTIIAGALTLLSKSAVEIGIEFEQSRIAFETMLGSGEKAGKLLKDLSDFAVKTPFNFPEVVQGAKQLLAMGSASEEVIKELKMLGDVSAGLDVPMSRLILNFGQARTAGKLTGRELRDFNVAGVPLVETLVKLGNEGKLTAGEFETVGGSAKGTGKKIDDLNFSIKKQVRRLEDMKEAGKKGTATYDNLADTIDRNRGKLGALGEVTSGFSQKIVYTKDKIAEMVSDGLIGFDDVSLAFESMTGEGGRFFDLMDKQSATLGGIISNIQDNFIRFALTVMGFNDDGEIRKGSIFYYLKEGAKKFQEMLDTLRPQVQGFLDMLFNNLPALTGIVGGLFGIVFVLGVAFAQMMAPALILIGIFTLMGIWAGKLIDKYGGLRAVIDKVKDRIEVLKDKFEIFREKIVEVWEFVSRFLIPIWDLMKDRIIKLMDRIKALNIDWSALVTVLKFLATVIGGILLAFILGLMVIITDLAVIIEKIVIPAIEFWIRKFTDTINIIKGLIGWLKEAYSWITKVFSKHSGEFKVSKSGGESWQHGGFINSPYGQAVPAMLHGGERVVPRTGTDVNGGGGGGVGTLNLNFTGSVTMDSDARVNDLAQKIVALLGRQSELAGKGLAI